MERDTATEDIVGPVEGVVTIKFKAALVTPYRDTVIFVFPAEIPVAAPMVVIAATVGAELAQVPVKVASSCDPSEKVARQVNCWLAFTDNLNGDFCSIVMEDIVTTGNVFAAELIPESNAVMLPVPNATAVTKPLEETVATVVSELFQVTLEVMSLVELSEYMPEAVNCWLVPNWKIPGCADEMLIEDNFGFGAHAPTASDKDINTVAK
jgi:hypothetical protein